MIWIKYKFTNHYLIYLLICTFTYIVFTKVLVHIINISIPIGNYCWMIDQLVEFVWWELRSGDALNTLVIVSLFQCWVIMRYIWIIDGIQARILNLDFGQSTIAFHRSLIELILSWYFLHFVFQCCEPLSIATCSPIFIHIHAQGHKYQRFRLKWQFCLVPSTVAIS